MFLKHAQIIYVYSLWKGLYTCIDDWKEWDFIGILGFSMNTHTGHTYKNSMWCRNLGRPKKRDVLFLWIGVTFLLKGWTWWPWPCRIWPRWLWHPWLAQRRQRAVESCWQEGEGKTPPKTTIGKSPCSIGRYIFKCLGFHCHVGVREGYIFTTWSRMIIRSQNVQQNSYPCTIPSENTHSTIILPNA